MSFIYLNNFITTEEKAADSINSVAFSVIFSFLRLPFYRTSYIIYFSLCQSDTHTLSNPIIPGKKITHLTGFPLSQSDSWMPPPDF